MNILHLKNNFTPAFSVYNWYPGKHFWVKRGFQRIAIDRVLSMARNSVSYVLQKSDDKHLTRFIVVTVSLWQIF